MYDWFKSCKYDYVRWVMLDMGLWSFGGRLLTPVVECKQQSNGKSC